jgi:hypothetical protein
MLLLNSANQKKNLFTSRMPPLAAQRDANPSCHRGTTLLPCRCHPAAAADATRCQAAEASTPPYQHHAHTPRSLSLQVPPILLADNMEEVQDPLKRNGMTNMIDWSIVSQRMHHIAFIAFFLSNQERVINMNLSPQLGIVIGKMQLNGSETMLALLIVSTTMLDWILMILVTKGKAFTLSCLMLVVRLKNSIKFV